MAGRWHLPACAKLHLSGVHPGTTHSSPAQGGLLEDDWATPVRDKLDRLARICPCPSRLEVDSSGRLLHVHIAGGGGSRRAEVSAARGQKAAKCGRMLALVHAASRCLCTTLLLRASWGYDLATLAAVVMCRCAAH